MFDNSVISPLIQRLGWSDKESVEFSGKLSADNKVSDSGRFLNSYHGLVTVENIYYSHPETGMGDTLLNAYLTQIRESAVREVLNEVFVKDPNVEEIDYSGVIATATGTGIFDDSIGYCHAIKVLELIMTSIRSNRNERMNKDSYATLKSEIEGFFTKDGVLASKGLMQRCDESLRSVKEHFYGKVYGAAIQDVTNCW